MNAGLILTAVGVLGLFWLIVVLFLGNWRPRLLDDKPHPEVTLDELLERADIDNWRADLDAERPEGCSCLWPPRGTEHSMIRSAKCDVHPPITRETNR